MNNKTKTGSVTMSVESVFEATEQTQSKYKPHQRAYWFENAQTIEQKTQMKGEHKAVYQRTKMFSICLL